MKPHTRPPREAFAAPMNTSDRTASKTKIGVFPIAGRGYSVAARYRGRGRYAWTCHRTRGKRERVGRSGGSDGGASRVGPRRSRRPSRSPLARSTCLPSRRCWSDFESDEHEVVPGKAAGADHPQVVAGLADRDVPVRVLRVIPGWRVVLTALAVLKHRRIVGRALDGLFVISRHGAAGSLYSVK